MSLNMTLVCVARDFQRLTFISKIINRIPNQNGTCICKFRAPIPHPGSDSDLPNVSSSNVTTGPRELRKRLLINTAFSRYTIVSFSTAEFRSSRSPFLPQPAGHVIVLQTTGTSSNTCTHPSSFTGVCTTASVYSSPFHWRYGFVTCHSFPAVRRWPVSISDIVTRHQTQLHRNYIKVTKE